MMKEKKIDIGIDTRKNVLTYSLFMENLLSIFLAKILGIENRGKSKILGNTGSSISFNQKVNLLIEIKALDASNSAKYITFMEVRNQFMHNLEADAYEKCFSFINGKAKYLLNLYPPQKAERDLEGQLAQAFQRLCDELIQTTVGLTEKIKEQITVKIRAELLAEFQNNTFEAIRYIEESLDDIYSKLEAKGKSKIHIKALKDLGTKVRKTFYSIVITKTPKQDKLSIPDKAEKARKEKARKI